MRADSSRSTHCPVKEARRPRVRPPRLRLNQTIQVDNKVWMLSSRDIRTTFVRARTKMKHDINRRNSTQSWSGEARIF